MFFCILFFGGLFEFLTDLFFFFCVRLYLYCTITMYELLFFFFSFFISVNFLRLVGFLSQPPSTAANYARTASSTMIRGLLLPNTCCAMPAMSSESTRPPNLPPRVRPAKPEDSPRAHPFPPVGHALVGGTTMMTV